MTAWHSLYPVFPPTATQTGIGMEYKTDIEETTGKEYRDEVWSTGRWRFTISGLKFLPTQVDGWTAFTMALRGAGGLCLYRPNSTIFQITNQNIGTGDGTSKTFQLIKSRSYEFGGPAPDDEVITRPWHNYPDLTFPSGTIALPSEMVQVFFDGVEKTLGADFTVDRDTGLITAAPGAGVVVTATCKYLVLCRFEGDYNPVTTDNGRSYELGDSVLVQPKGVA